MISVSFDEIRIPPGLVSRINPIFKCVLLPEEIGALNAALFALDLALAEDDSVPPDYSVNMILTSTDSFNLVQRDPGVMGHCYHLVVLYVHHWRSQQLPINVIAAVILEEFCHHFWRIADETLVKYKVLEVYRYIDSSVQMQELYRLDP